MRRREFITGLAALVSSGYPLKEALAQFNGCLPGFCPSGTFGGGGGPSAINWVAEGDSITFGLGGQPSYPPVVLSSLTGIASTPNTNTPTSGLVSAANANVNLNVIATSGISTITADSTYSTRAGANFVAGKLNVLSLMLGTNTSGSSDQTAQQKYSFIRDYLRKAEVTGYTRKLLCSMIPRDDDAGVAWSTVLVPLNTLFSTYYNSDLRCDDYVDFTTNTHFSTAASADDLTYYVPGAIHPSVVGEALMGSIAQSGILAFLQGPGVRTQVLTWSTINADQAPLATLTNSNRTVTGSSGQILGFPATNSGNPYFEINVDTVGSFCAIGLANEAWALSGQFIYAGTNSVAWLADGRFFINGAQVATGTAYTTGDRLQFAYNRTTQKAWMRPVRSGTPLNWNGNASADPVSGVGGFDVSTIGASNYIHAGANYGGPLTTCFSAAQMIGPVPSGYTVYGP